MTWTDVTITYLEMRDRADFRPRRAARDGVSLALVNPPSATTNAWFYAAVGGAWHWTDRAQWTAAQWEAELQAPGTETWVLSVDDREAGFFELTAPEPGRSEIQYLGLLPGFEGQGLGAHLLTLAVERAWETGASRVTVNTCTLDHPSALANYQARGFTIVDTRTERREVV